jgi:hypothetical protein
MFIKPGKRTKAWNAARPKLKAEYLERGITYCEVGLPNCTGTYNLSFAHRYKRRDPRCEHSFEGTLLCCIPCHTVLEKSKDLTEEYFTNLRNI